MALFVVPLAVYGHSVGESEDLFYYAFDEKVPIVTVPGKFMFKKKPTVDQKQMEVVVGSILDKVNFDWFNSDICTVQTDEDLVDHAIGQLLTRDEILSARRIYNIMSDVKYFKEKLHQKPLDLGLIDQILLKFKDNISQSVKDNIKHSFGLIPYEENEVFEICFVEKNVDILDVSHELFETGLFVFAYPELICQASSCDEPAVYPNDPYFQYQVTLHNTGQTFNGHTGTINADIDAPEAWALTMGNDSIIIAVIDQGITSNHPDLPNTRQVRLNGSNFGEGAPNDPSPIGNDNHGNACAGVIAATADNGEGIAGIAPLCKIMPVRTDTSTTPGNRAIAIMFAADNGARIISNSWGYKSPYYNLHPCIVCAITYAIGKNCLVLFSAGNTANHTIYDDGYVIFPANRSISGKLTVGASDRYDSQADYSPTSSLIDIVAPSHRAYPYDHNEYTGINGETLEMWSIDIPGNNGYNPWASDLGPFVAVGSELPDSGTNYLSYTGHFGGTSHSCAVVAGVAALILSVNTHLPIMTVCDVLTGTAEKVGVYNYDPVSGRCDEMGYGRVNAKNAVWEVCDTIPYIGKSYRRSNTLYGCDIYMENDRVIRNGILHVRPKNSVIISKDFLIELGSSMDIERVY